MIKFYIFLLSVLLGLSQVSAENLGLAPMDVEYENRLYQIYKKYHHQSMTPQQWTQISQSHASNSYVIQKGDNLWDISYTLFGNSHYWPKIWSINQKITNPHRLHAGQSLYFIMGSEFNPPQLGISPVNANQEDASSGALQNSNSTNPSMNRSTEVSQSGLDPNLQNQVILADGTVSAVDSQSEMRHSCSPFLSDTLQKSGSTRVYNHLWQCRSVQKRLQDRRMKDHQKMRNRFKQPVPRFRALGQIPSSLPEWEVSAYIPPQDHSIAKFPTFPNQNVILRFLAQKRDVPIIGEVQSVDDYLPVATSEIVVALDVPAQKGDVFSLIRPLKRVSSQKISVRNPSGYEVALQAVIQIKEPVANQRDLYFAEIQKLYNPISKQSKVIQGGALFFSIKENKHWASTNAQIVGISSDQSSDTLMLHSFVYLSKGMNQNVRPGESFKIWQNSKLHSSSMNRPIGEVLVVHASNHASTGFVTQLNAASYVGDFVRPHGSLTRYEWDTKDDDIYEDKVNSEEDMQEDMKEEDLIEGDPEFDPSPMDDDFEEVDRVDSQEMSSEDESFDEELDESENFETIDTQSEDSQSMITEGDTGDSESILEAGENEGAEDFSSENDSNSKDDTSDFDDEHTLDDSIGAFDEPNKLEEEFLEDEDVYEE